MVLPPRNLTVHYERPCIQLWKVIGPAAFNHDLSHSASLGHNKPASLGDHCPVSQVLAEASTSPAPASNSAALGSEIVEAVPDKLAITAVPLSHTVPVMENG